MAEGVLEQTAGPSRVCDRTSGRVLKGITGVMLRSAVIHPFDDGNPR